MSHPLLMALFLMSRGRRRRARAACTGRRSRRPVGRRRAIIRTRAQLPAQIDGKPRIGDRGFAGRVAAGRVERVHSRRDRHRSAGNRRRRRRGAAGSRARRSGGARGRQVAGDLKATLDRRPACGDRSRTVARADRGRPRYSLGVHARSGRAAEIETAAGEAQHRPGRAYRVGRLSERRTKNEDSEDRTNRRPREKD